jgi:hypothetical protein
MCFNRLTQAIGLSASGLGWARSAFQAERMPEE